MGGDGGSFSGRAEMVRTKGFKFLRNLGGMGYTPNTQIRAGDERLSKNENRDLQTSACALSEVTYLEHSPRFEANTTSGACVLWMRCD